MMMVVLLLHAAASAAAAGYAAAAARAPSAVGGVCHDELGGATAAIGLVEQVLLQLLLTPTPLGAHLCWRQEEHWG